MSCCHYQPTGDGLDTAFAVDASRITFGRGCLEELGDRAQALGMTRVALFSDAVVARLSVFDTAQRSLRAAGIDVIPYTEVHIEPTDESFRQAAAFASQTMWAATLAGIAFGNAGVHIPHAMAYAVAGQVRG